MQSSRVKNNAANRYYPSPTEIIKPILNSYQNNESNGNLVRLANSNFKSTYQADYNKTDQKTARNNAMSAGHTSTPMSFMCNKVRHSIPSKTI